MKLADILFVLGLILVLVPAIIYNVMIGTVLTGLVLIALSTAIASTLAREETKDKKDKT